MKMQQNLSINTNIENQTNTKIAVDVSAVMKAQT